MKKLGTVLEYEKRELLKLRERVDALIDLNECRDNLDLDLNEQDGLKVEIKERYEETLQSIDQWWDSIINKYNIDKKHRYNLLIEYGTNDILMKQGNK